jgi:diguanylate cyclase (GGDEF)-like protein
LLAALGTLLREQFPEPAVVVRWGGEEFLAVLPVRSESDALERSESARSAVETHLIDLGGVDTLGCTVSLGFACYPFDVSSPQQIGWQSVLEIADRALYAAKEEGRNRAFGYVCAGPVDHEFSSQLHSGPQALADARWLRLIGVDAPRIAATSGHSD